MEKKSSVPSNFFEYSRMINYFLTIFFIFLLMISILLFINLSRAVLSDADVERHLTQTKSLLQELEEVENTQSRSYINMSTNFSHYSRNSPLTRLNIDDVSLYQSEVSGVAYLTLKSLNYSYETIHSSIIVTNIDPLLYDMIIFKDPSSTLERGLIIGIREKLQGSPRAAQDSVLTSNEYLVLKDSSFIRGDDATNQSTNINQKIENEIVRISKNEIKGVEILKNSEVNN